MKARYLLFGIMALTLFSCEKINNDRKIWDIYPVVVTVQVLNASGTDLLNPDNQNSIDSSSIKAVYKGLEYECNKNISQVYTKAYLPHFYGLKLQKNPAGKYYLLFGEFDGAKSYTNEEVTLFWGDGSSDKIEFNRQFKWKSNGDPSISQEWFLNGNKVTESLIKIVK